MTYFAACFQSPKCQVLNLPTFLLLSDKSHTLTIKQEISHYQFLKNIRLNLNSRGDLPKSVPCVSA